MAGVESVAGAESEAGAKSGKGVELEEDQQEEEVEEEDGAGGGGGYPDVKANCFDVKSPNGDNCEMGQTRRAEEDR